MITFGMESLSDQPSPIVPFPIQDVSQLQPGGRYAISGMVWHMEYVTGDVRTGRGPNGSSYETSMVAAYGEVEGTSDADGEPVDIFINQKSFDPSAPVRIADFVKEDGTFDEHKLWVGYSTEAQVREDFAAMYNGAPVKIGGMVDIPFQSMRTWVTSPDTKRPVMDRDSQVAMTTMAKVGEMQRILLPRTDKAPKIVVDKSGENARIGIYILSEFSSADWGATTETIIQLITKAAPGDTIAICISSYGGELDLAARIASAVRLTEATVTTVAIGPVASAGCLLWCEGHTRLVSRGSYFMQHEAGCLVGGKTSEIVRYMEATNEYVRTIVFARAISTGLFTADEIAGMVDRSQDVYISARTAAERTGSEII